MPTPLYPTHPCDGCHKPVIWANNTRTGHTIDLDPEPVFDGRFRVVSNNGNKVWVRAVHAVESVTTAFGVKLYKDHLQTCPKADYLRQKQRAERRYR